MLRRLSNIAAAPPTPPMPSAAPEPAAVPQHPAADRPPTWLDLSQRLTQHLQATIGQATSSGSAAPVRLSPVDAPGPAATANPPNNGPSAAG